MKARILTAVVVLPLLILFVAFASLALFNGVLCVLCALALHEFYGMSLGRHRRAEAYLGVAGGVAMLIGQLFGSGPVVPLASIALPVLALCLVYLFRFQDLDRVARDLAMTLFGWLYVPLLLAHAGLLRELPAGRSWIFLVLLIVMVSDTLAYFVGRRWGRRKLYPAISPNKSIEGALGGLLGGLLGAVLGVSTFAAGLSLFEALLIGILVGGFSQLGDLVESMFKRSFKVKDSGALIPGHGGILDRLDSLLFAFPLTFYCVLWMAP